MTPTRTAARAGPGLPADRRAGIAASSFGTADDVVTSSSTDARLGADAALRTALRQCRGDRAPGHPGAGLGARFAWYHRAPYRLGHVPVLHLAAILIGLPVIAYTGARLLAGMEPPIHARPPLD